MFTKEQLNSIKKSIESDLLIKKLRQRDRAMEMDVWLELYTKSFELELLEAELERKDNAFRWLVENGNPDGDYLGCPYHRFFDTNKRCPLWTQRINCVSDESSVEEWKEIVFGEDELYDDVDCSTHPEVCWKRAYELSKNRE